MYSVEHTDGEAVLAVAQLVQEGEHDAAMEEVSGSAAEPRQLAGCGHSSAAFWHKLLEDQQHT
jgi:hypothetical protein